MFTKVNYYYFDKLFTEEFCDNVINVGNALKKDQEGIIGSNGERNAGGKDLKVRNSNVAWITDFKILQGCKEAMQKYEELIGILILDLNTDLSAQFTKYSKGQFYDWHCDSFQRDGRNKLSFTLNLSHPSTYVGGEFEFDYRMQKRIKNRNS